MPVVHFALPQFKLLEAAALPEWVPSLEAGNQSEQGLYLFLDFSA
ncbi:hypothetical protein [Nostoc edaphicum]|nr:hypothetical protein [Nostoc edaphicum]